MLFFIISQISAGFRTYGGSDDDRIWAFDLNAPGDRIVQVMLTKSYKIDNSTGSDFVVSVISKTGIPIWQRAIGRSNFNDWPYDITYDNQGNIIVLALSCVPYNGDPYTCAESDNNRVGIIKLDANNGQIIKSVQFRGGNKRTNWIRASQIANGNNGEFVVAGYVLFEGDGWSEPPARYDGYVIKFNSNLDVIWKKVLIGEDEAYTRSIVRTADGNFMVFNDNSAAQMYSFSIAKLKDQDGSPIYSGGLRMLFLDLSQGYDKFIVRGTSDNAGNVIFPGQVLQEVCDSMTQYGCAKSHRERRTIIWIFNQNAGLKCYRFLEPNIQQPQQGTEYMTQIFNITDGGNYFYATGIDLATTSQSGHNPYHYATYGGDLFYIKIDKNDCSIINNKMRYILSDGADGGYNIRKSNDTIYVSGFTNKSGWTIGSFDGVIAADRDIQDTCYWRSKNAITEIPYFDIYTGTLSVEDFDGLFENGTFVSVPVIVSSNTQCGILTPVNNYEKYEDCYISITKDGKYLKIISKDKQDIDIRFYSVDGRLAYSKSLRQFEGSIDEPLKLSSGVYIAKVSYRDKVIQKKFIIK